MTRPPSPTDVPPLPARLPASPVRAALATPLFWKIVLANVLLVALSVAAAVGLGGDSAVWVAALAVAVSAAVNGVLVRLALVPLKALEATARKVQEGDVEARVPPSALADRSTAELMDTFNAMLDGLGVYRQRLRDVAARALNAEEEERKRIARELHDDTAQSLAALLIRLRVARSGPEPVAVEDLLEDLRREIADTLEGIRRYARGLRPPALDELGLVPAIESFARSLTEGAGLPVEVHSVDMEERTLTPEAELALYRIVQESLSNVVRHAGATCADVVLRQVRGVVVAEVTDDGRGFDPAATMVADVGGLGLFGMHERAAYVGGRVLVTSRPGEGTTVRVEVPV